MITAGGRGILLDIEGTTSSISYIYDVMFPFARRELDGYLHDQWGSDPVAQVCELVARDAGHESFSAWAGCQPGDETGLPLVRDEVVRQMDSDMKATGLKQLQGLIWRGGFHSGQLQAHVYDDVLPALVAWNEAGRDVRIYSSGSVQAQQLFFGHTEHGDLLPYFNGHYDTMTGSKREAASYRAIAEDYGLAGEEILFLSDVEAELDAARQAGMQTAICIRPGNDTTGLQGTHPELTDFGQIELV